MIELDPVKLVVIVLLFVVVVAMGSGLLFLVRDSGGGSKRTLKSLTARIGISIGILILLLVAIKTGMIKPHGVTPAPHSIENNSESHSAN